MQNVFVTNFKDQQTVYTETEEFRGKNGQVIPITEGPRVSVFNTDGLIQDIRYQLEHNRFDPDNDYVMIAGNSIIAALVIKVIMDEYVPERLHLLLYNHKTNDYIHREV